MRALLVLYMVDVILRPGHIETVLGMSSLRSLLATAGALLSGQALASAIFGIFAGSVFLTPVLGGLLADRLLGRKRTVILGALLMASGHFLMAFEAPFLLALMLLVLGVGCFKGNIASQVSALYRPDDQRRADAFQIFYLGINAGAICAPLVCGTLGETLGWEYGFGVAGIGMLIGLAIYIAGQPYLAQESPQAISSVPTLPMTRRERMTLMLLIAMLPVFAIGLIPNQQVDNAYLIWARASADLTAFDRSVPVSWLLTLESIATVLCLPVSVAFWRFWARRANEPNEVTKIVIGMAFLCLAPALLTIGAAEAAAAGRKVAIGWLIAFAIVNEIGFSNVLPVSLALYARAAPPRFASTIIGIYYLQLVGASLLAGAVGTYLNRLSAVHFWGLHVACVGMSVVALIVIRSTTRPLLYAPASVIASSSRP
jgi:POT family proton-dependent oligopeptide transporter